ncbi:histone acetyltransferase [Ceratobasidium sp. 428]|nr:histone acetyltransferase [Ceratobasidium sp. 428]
MALPLTFLYPPAAQPGGFTFEGLSVKIARHSNCSECECRGWHPPEGCTVVIANGSLEAQAALDEAEELAGQVTDITQDGFWRMCACGDGIEDHGVQDISQEEIERRGRVAIRIDEILEDKGLLSDFQAALSDPDVISLRKQMVPFDESNSRGSEVMSPPSSPVSQRSSSSSALSDLPPAKHRKAQDLNYSSEEDEVPLAATSRPPTITTTAPEPPRAPSSASASSGFDIEMEMELDNEPEPEPTSGQRGGKSAAAQPGMHKTVAAMGPAALPVDAPMVVEPVRPEVSKVPVDERQIARLATGAAVDVSAFSEACT